MLDVAPVDFECGEVLGVLEKATAIGRALAKLNARERKVVAPLFQNAGDRPTMKQLGRTLKLSEGGVRALRFRGLRKLTRALQEMGFVLFRPSVRKTSSD
jgi:DNA-directed RNA polymerase sigma subunit (sigma70/sigma32)